MATPNGASIFPTNILVTNTNKPLGTNTWALEPMYWVGTKDKWLVWQIMFDKATLLTKTGYLDGKHRETSSNVIQELSEYNIPREPIGIAFRTYE